MSGPVATTGSMPTGPVGSLVYIRLGGTGKTGGPCGVLDLVAGAFDTRRRRRRGPRLGSTVDVTHTDTASAIWISVTGSVAFRAECEGGGAPAGGDQLGREGGDHRAVVGAQRQRRMRTVTPAAIGALQSDLAQTPVRDHSPAEQQPRHTEVGAGGERLRDQNVDDRLAEARGDVGERNLDPLASQRSTQRATAVFSPENEKS